MADPHEFFTPERTDAVVGGMAGVFASLPFLRGHSWRMALVALFCGFVAAWFFGPPLALYIDRGDTLHLQGAAGLLCGLTGMGVIRGIVQLSEGFGAELKTWFRRFLNGRERK